MKRVLFYLIGLSLIAFGVAKIIIADMGAGAWDALVVGLSQTFGLTMGIWVVILGLLLICINALLLKERPDFLALLTSFILGMMVDFWIIQIFHDIVPTTFYQQILFFALGFLAIILGTGAYIQANFAPLPADKLMLAFHQRFNISIGKSGLFSEALAVIMSLIFSGPIFFGTVIVAVAFGPCVQFVNMPMKKLYERV